MPVLAGYLFLGMAFGILMSSKGYGAVYSVLASVFIYAGSMQFAMVVLLTAPFDPLYAFLLALMVNARHLFYGISMLGPFRDSGAAKPYLIFGLTDETFSVLCEEFPENVDPRAYMLGVTALNQCYWVSGTALGALVGSFVHFSTKGIDFAMTALFVVIFVDQWRSKRGHAPALIGVLASLLCLLLFGAKDFIIPAMALIIVLLTLLGRHSGELGGEIR